MFTRPTKISYGSNVIHATATKLADNRLCIVWCSLNIAPTSSSVWHNDGDDCLQLNWFCCMFSTIVLQFAWLSQITTHKIDLCHRRYVRLSLQQQSFVINDGFSRIIKVIFKSSRENFATLFFIKKKRQLQTLIYFTHFFSPCFDCQTARRLTVRSVLSPFRSLFNEIETLAFSEYFCLYHVSFDFFKLFKQITFSRLAFFLFLERTHGKQTNK